ncbi:putative WRKY transcription factor 50 [Dichanthelium oligosanthes]|uniref:Putative WRKY transcription factor 50 n=1 Tax=Dichanthelium oligosanthes TaxID=888268 RepID=A0A1E5W5H3_9POAL|nr:putative WRKY transcription factor 50 [Dichanthelium oligosanthes]
MHMALASWDSLAADAVFPAMAYRHPCSNGGGLASSGFYGASSPAAALFPQPAFGGGAAPGLAPPQQPDAFECLSDEGVSSVVPGTFGTPPPPPPPRQPRMPAEQVVPDASSGYTTHVRGAAAMATTDRIAFRVRSEEEVLDDGYKWRKYGKKSVKNSPNPRYNFTFGINAFKLIDYYRNYYRCSTEGCNVKKRVERDKDDPSYVVTMYEGVHNHVSPGTIYYATQDAASGRFFVAGMHQLGH